MPLTLAIALSIIQALLIFSDPAVLQEIAVQREHALEKQVESGKLSRAQANRAGEVSERFVRPAFLKVVGSLKAVGVEALRWACVGLEIWALARWWFGVRLPLSKALEIAGLASVVLALGAIVSTLLILIRGTTLANLGPILLVTEPDPGRVRDLALSTLNVISLWYWVVIACGAGRFMEKPVSTLAAWLIGTWALFKFGSLLLIARMT